LPRLPGWPAWRASRAFATLLAGAAAAGAVLQAQAHGFDERYDLPVPLAWVVAAACALVALSFVAAVAFGRRVGQAPARRRGVEISVPAALLLATRSLAWALFVLTIAAALWGSRDPMMNLAPTLVWIVWWVGLSFVAALVGKVWAALDPWRSSFALLQALANAVGRAFAQTSRQTPGPALARPASPDTGRNPRWRWPATLGQWPAVALLLAWCWLEVVMPLAATPFKLGLAALAWTLASLAGMAAFGRAAWQANVDVFALVFSTLGRMAPLRLRIDADEPVQPRAGQVGFVMAMLSTVVFDGLHGGAAWNAFEGVLRRLAPGWIDTNGLFAGTTGLLAVWLVFVLAYTATLRLSLALMGPPVSAPAAARAALAAQLAVTLVPIALAYNVAHNFSSLLIQGQTVLQLLSDPFGRQWDLFGTARLYPDIGIVDARMTWFVAVTAIVAGHMLSMLWSHRVVLAAGVAPRRAAWAMLPLTGLMLAFTATSLLLIAEPMVAAPAAEAASATPALSPGQ
jgi:hypothetical protein